MRSGTLQGSLGKVQALALLQRVWPLPTEGWRLRGVRHRDVLLRCRMKLWAGIWWRQKSLVAVSRPLSQGPCRPLLCCLMKTTYRCRGQRGYWLASPVSMEAQEASCLGSAGSLPPLIQDLQQVLLSHQTQTEHLQGH